MLLKEVFRPIAARADTIKNLLTLFVAETKAERQKKLSVNSAKDDVPCDADESAKNIENTEDTTDTDNTEN